MINRKISNMKRDELIQEINILGPWVHGYFDLGNGLIIEDQDELQKKRLFSSRDFFIDIIHSYYKKKDLSDKTLCDVGCNTGYFLYELFKKFNFKKVLGIEPRESNLDKAQFMADFFNLPKKRFELKELDILTDSNELPVYDVVIMPGVLHHLDNHLQALKNLYKMTRDFCILETLVLSDDFNTDSIADQLELKDKIYQVKENKNKFGIVGYKLESDRLDGTTVHSGIVSIPTTEALLMMMNHVGFSNVRLYRSEEQLRKEIFSEKSYREYRSVVIVGYKKTDEKTNYITSINETLDEIEKTEFNNVIPLELIEPLYQVIIGNSSKDDLPDIPKLIYESELYYKEKIGEKAGYELRKKVRSEKYYPIINTFKHAPTQKISFEYAKTCYQKGMLDKAKVVAEELVKTINLDWRTVYSTYYLLAVIYFEMQNKSKAKFYNDLSIRTNNLYSLSRELKKRLEGKENR